MKSIRVGSKVSEDSDSGAVASEMTVDDVCKGVVDEEQEVKGSDTANNNPTML